MVADPRVTLAVNFLGAPALTLSEMRGYRQTTAAGLQGQVPDLPPGVIDADSFCYDMMYGTEPTAFMRYAAAQGCEASHDGLGMLVEQAAESFFIWRGVRPDTTPVLKQMKITA